MALYSQYGLCPLTTAMVVTCAEARQVDQFEELKVNWTLAQRETKCNGTLSDGCYTPNYVADVFFFSCLIFLGTFVLSFYLKLFRNTRFFPNKASQSADNSNCVDSVASLGLVSPGAATDGVTFFSWKKLTTFFVIALYKVTKSGDLFYLSSRHNSHVPTSLFSVRSKFSPQFFFTRVSPLDGVTRGAAPSSP